MADKQQILIEVPREVSAWIEKQGDEHFRSKRGECAYILTEAYKAATGKNVEEPTSVQDNLEDAAAEVPADTPAAETSNQ